jgi:hypothetical protein
MGKRWLDQGRLDLQKSKVEFKLNTHQKHLLLMALYSSPKVELADKTRLLEKVLANDKSDIAERTRLVCYAALPDPIVKEEVWNQIVQANSSRTSKQRECFLYGFFSSWE